jgi:serine/threonine protein kinase
LRSAAIQKRNELAWQTLSGLAYLHLSHVVHQDIKPENVLITDLDHWLHARIADFGIARPLTQSQDLHTWEAPLAGLDHRYASPEQLAGRSVTAASDVYSWALTMLASAPKTDYRQSLAQLKSNREQFIDDRLASLAEMQGTVATAHLKSALTPDPQARPSAHELLEAFQPLTEEPPLMACMEASPPTPYLNAEAIRPRRQRRPSVPPRTVTPP